MEEVEGYGVELDIVLDCNRFVGGLVCVYVTAASCVFVWRRMQLTMMANNKNGEEDTKSFRYLYQSFFDTEAPISISSEYECLPLRKSIARSVSRF